MNLGAGAEIKRPGILKLKTVSKKFFSPDLPVTTGIQKPPQKFSRWQKRKRPHG